MNKVKMFFIAAALVLTTAGVFAGKKVFFATPTNIYYSSNGSNFFVGLGSLTGVTDNVFSTTQTLSEPQIKFTSSAGTVYGLYTYSGTSYLAIYSAF